MDWYVVIKTINARAYVYRQRTFRQDGHVKTECEYVGPSAGEPLPGELAELANAARTAVSLTAFLDAARGLAGAAGMSERRLAALYWQSIGRTPTASITNTKTTAGRGRRGRGRAG